MLDWYGEGKIAGSELAEKDAVQLEHNTAEELTNDEKMGWIDGVIDGVEGKGRRLKGIRVSNSLIDLMRSKADPHVLDHYRGYPFAASVELWPQTSIHAVLNIRPRAED